MQNPTSSQELAQLAQSNSELVAILRVALPATAALLLLTWIVLVVVLARIKAHLDASREATNAEIRKMLKKHLLLVVDAFEDSTANEMIEMKPPPRKG